MSKFDNLKVGDMIYITGVEANLYECNDDNYDTLLGVVNQFCKVVDVSGGVDLYVLSENSEESYCNEIHQRGVLIQNPKLQGHDGGGRCPEYNCFWIGKEYVSFDSISVDYTMNIFDKLNESDDFGWAEEIVKDIPEVVDYRNVKQGDKVVPGKHWLFGDQADGAVYGIVDLEEYDGEPAFIDDSTDEEFHQYWVHVDWVNKKGDSIFRNNYRVGPGYYDLKYYTPKPTKKKKIREGYWEEKYKSKRYTQKFNIGDRVVMNGTVGDKSFNNELGTVLKYKFTGGCAGHPAPDTTDVFDQLNESDDFGWAEEIVNSENIIEITYNDLQVGMTVIVNGYDSDKDYKRWENELGTVVYDYNQDENETSNSFIIAFKNWDHGHDGNHQPQCNNSKCWSFYDDCAYSDDDNCQNIDNIKFYTVNTYDLFDQLNESEDEFEWAKETINQEYNRYGDILPYLDFDDVISITGDFTSDEGELLISVKDEPFKVYKKNKTVFLIWVKPENERPKDWKSITNDHGDVSMSQDTFEWDKELLVKILHKEEHPF